MDLDLYAYFGLNFDASENDIKKAYKFKAKELHPDKNKDSKDAKEKFQALKDYYDILNDKVKKNEYDRKWNAKREAEKRNANLSKERRLLKEKLEAQEKMARENHSAKMEFNAKKKAAEELRRKWQVEQDIKSFNAMKERKLMAEQAFINQTNNQNSVTFKAKWKSPSLEKYNKETLSGYLAEFSSDITIVIGKKQSAIIEFNNKHEALEAYKASSRGLIGDASNPITLSWLGGAPHEADQTEEPEDEITISTTFPSCSFLDENTGRSSVEQKSQKRTANFTNYESDILAKMMSFTKS